WTATPLYYTYKLNNSNTSGGRFKNHYSQEASVHTKGASYPLNFCLQFTAVAKFCFHATENFNVWCLDVQFL
ncbi:unnamed protein product, partial [Prunus brigantina]